MNVLYVSNCFSFTPTHAAAVTTYEIVKRLARKGHKVTMLVPNIEYDKSIQSSTIESYLLDNVNVITSTSSPVYSTQENLVSYGLECSVLYLPLIVKALTKRKHFEAVISMFHPSHLATFSAYVISRILKLPFIVKVHDLLPDLTDPNTLRRVYKKVMFKLYCMFLRKGDLFLVPSVEWMGLAVKVYGLSEKKLILFPNGVDVVKFNPKVKDDRLREDLGLEDKRILIFSGRTGSRGLNYLIKALPSIVKQEPVARVLIIGRATEKSRLLELSEHIGVDNFIIFVNEVSHDSMPGYISLADIAIGPLTTLPITIGTLPIKVLEYMACGKPVVACYNGFSRDLIRDGHNGTLITPGNVKELSSAIVSLLKDDNLAKYIGMNARKRIENFHDWDVIIETLNRLLGNLAKGARGLSLGDSLAS